MVVNNVVLTGAVDYRNRIDRITGSADVFYITGVYTPNILWTAFKTDDQVLRELLLTLLNLLSELGIGGYRSMGWEKFELLDSSLADKVEKRDLEVLMKDSG